MSLSCSQIGWLIHIIKLDAIQNNVLLKPAPTVLYAPTTANSSSKAANYPVYPVGIYYMKNTNNL